MTRPPSDTDTTAAAIWRRKSDEEVSAALTLLHEYTEEGQEIIQGEATRRRKLPPPPRRDTWRARTLTEERNWFLGWLFAMFAMNIVFRLGALSAPAGAAAFVPGLGMFLTFVTKSVLVYFVFRLSRVLSQPAWLTIGYCALAPFSVLYLIPCIGLLIGVKNARRALLSSAAPRARAIPPR